MDVFLNQLFVGLSIASILLLVALGLTFTFGQMNVINMAHGEFIMAGAYTPTCCRRRSGPGRSGSPSVSRCRSRSSSPGRSG